MPVMSASEQLEEGPAEEAREAAHDVADLEEVVQDAEEDEADDGGRDGRPERDREREADGCQHEERDGARAMHGTDGAGVSDTEPPGRVSAVTR